MSVEPSGVGETIADSLVYEWSIGNGESRSGKEVEYMFHHPGQYVVVVSGEFKRQKQFARHTITVLPVELELTKTSDGTAHILRNLSGSEINVGGYRLVGTSEYIFPKHVILLPQSEVAIPMKATSNNLAVTALYDESGEAVAIHVPGFISPASRQMLASESVMQTSLTSPTRQTGNQPSSSFGFVSDTPPAPVSAAAIDVQPLIPVALAAEEDTLPNSTSDTDWPLYGLIALLIFGTAGIYLVPPKKDDPPWV